MGFFRYPFCFDLSKLFFGLRQVLSSQIEENLSKKQQQQRLMHFYLSMRRFSFSSFNDHVHSPAQLVRGLTLGSIVWTRSSWSRVSSFSPPPPPPPGTCLHFYRAQGSQRSHFSAFYALRLASNFATHVLALSVMSICNKESLVIFEPIPLTS